MSENDPKFTPGPWWALLEGTMDVFVEPGIWYKEVDSRYCLREEVVANAYLTSAAPDFYKDEMVNLRFLQGVKDGIAALVAEPVPTLSPELAELARTWTDMVDRRMAEIEALLAKARGEE